MLYLIQYSTNNIVRMINKLLHLIINVNFTYKLKIQEERENGITFSLLS